MNINEKGIITLIKSAFTGESLSLPKEFLLENAVSIIKKHNIETLAYYGAVNCNINTDLPVMQKLFDRVCVQISQSQNQLVEIEKLFNAFEENNIDYLPVKGTLIKSWYKKSEMRFMSDADILIRTEQYDKIKPIMQKLKYNEGPESLCELIWDKPFGLHAELHKSLIPPIDKDFYSYFGTGWELAKKVSDKKNRYELTDEDHFIFVFAHFVRHYRSGGIGIKHMADLWVFKNEKSNMDFEYIENELKKLNLYEFYVNVFNTLKVWFEDKRADNITDLITTAIFESGAYGTHKQTLISDAAKLSKDGQNAKKSKKLWLIFLPYQNMCIKYPFLKKLPFLLPIMWIVRAFSIVCYKKDKIKRSFNEIEQINSSEVEEFRQSLELVGLKL